MTRILNNEMTLYISNVRGRVSNTSYPFKAQITGIEDLAQAVLYDHVSACYKDGENGNGKWIKSHRAKKDFESADNICMDCDNVQKHPLLPDISPEEWKTPDNVQAAFPDVAFYYVPSRNNMKEKDGLSARPKGHYYFPHKNKITNADKWTAMKEDIIAIFPAFDDNAKDAARFMYGVENPQPVFYPGKLCIDEFLEQRAVENKSQAQKLIASKFGDIIPIGQRNSTLSRFAATVLKKYGNKDEKAYLLFIERAAQCEQSLPDSELEAIWRSADSNYTRNTSKAPEYIPPQEYVAQDFETSLIPSDYTDVGQANLFAGVYGEKVKYTTATKYIINNGKVWQESEIKAQGLSQELTERQLEEARKRVRKAQTAYNKAVEAEDGEKVAEAKKHLNYEESFRAFVLSRRKTDKVKATLTEARTKLEIDVSNLDADGFLLNTPGGTVMLRTGKMRPHNPVDYCTKITAVAPGTEGAEVFDDFIKRVTCNDAELECYLQEVAGMCAVGKVLRENLIIAYGGGGNGKSTLFNLLSRVMGDYAGGISSEVLTANCRKNKSPEYAELRGKRLVIAAELEEGVRLDTAIVKKLCSTDPIAAEKKYKDPFVFIPSHTVILYTNHLPKVGTVDKGTWDRLIAVPFNANFRGIKGEILNYADYLFENAGGAVLAWIIEGARRFIANDYKINLPECVKTAIEKYRANNDWLSNFLSECCEVLPTYEEMSGELYARYRIYCQTTGDYIRRADAFRESMENAGFRYHKDNKGTHVYGLHLKFDFMEYSEQVSCSGLPPLSG